MQITDVTFTVKWSKEDDEWVATCDKFPSLSVLDFQPEDALDELLELVSMEFARRILEKAHDIKG